MSQSLTDPVLSRLETAMEHALHLVPVHWHAAFVRFMETGEAPQAFFEYLEADADCCQACEIVLRGDTELELAIRLAQEHSP